MSANEIFQGLTWQDMPGKFNIHKRMNFALFKRGELSREDATTKGRKSSQKRFGEVHAYARGRAINNAKRRRAKQALRAMEQINREIDEEGLV